MEPEDGLVSIKVENDSEVATNIIKYNIATPNMAKNSGTSIASNDRALSELSTLREKYSQVVFDLQKSKQTVNSLVLELDEVKAQLARSDELLLSSNGDKQTLLQQLENLRKEICTNLTIFQQEKQAGAGQMKILKKENNELRARLKQVQLSINQNQPSRRQKTHEANENNTYEVHQLLDHKENKSGRFFFVSWKGFGPEENSWVKESDLLCPALLKSYLKKKKSFK